MRKKITMLFAALLACAGVMAQWGESDLAVSSVSTTPATTLENGYYVIYNNGRGTFMNTEEALGQAKVTWPVTASASGIDAFNNNEALTNAGATDRNAYVFYLTLEEGGKLSLMTCHGDYVPALTANATFSYTTEKGLWNYNFMTEGENSYLFLWSDSQVGLDANGWGADTHTYSTVAGWDKDGSSNVSGNQSWTLHKATMSSASEVYRTNLASLKTLAESKMNELETLPATTPVTTAITALGAAVAEAEANAESTDIDVLSATIETLSTAIAMDKNLSFEGGALASLEEGKYVVYYEDEEGVKHYLVNNKATNRAVTYTTPALYIIKPGNVNGGYASYAHFFEMNESRLSNPTNDDAKEIQVMTPGQNYERVWESPVLYVNAEGKYAIRSTNCTAGSGWSSDHFIDVDEAGTSISASAATLGDALYKWNIMKASEENVVFDMAIDQYRYMTLFLNYAVKVPTGVTAYAVSGVENGELTLTSVGDVIPENTPVIIEGEAGNYPFVYAASVAAYAETNLLKGTWYDCNVAPTSGCDAYIMALDKENDRIVMGKALLNANGGTTQFKNRANKAYLELPTAQAAGAPMFSFGRGEGTTGIENSELNIENPAFIYDLLGRRVKKMEKGIYIVNGKKVIR